MGTISVSLPSDGTIADTADYNNPITTIVDEFNGNIDNSNIKSSAAIATSKLANDGGIGPSKLGLGAQSATVTTSQTTTSTSFTDLSTVGPEVTVTIGSNGLALVILTCEIFPASGAFARMGFALSGANTLAANAVDSLFSQLSGSQPDFQGSFVKLLTGLSPGSTVFTAKYSTSAGTSTFLQRKIAVIPL